MTVIMANIDMAYLHFIKNLIRKKINERRMGVGNKCFIEANENE